MKRDDITKAITLELNDLPDSLTICVLKYIQELKLASSSGTLPEIMQRDFQSHVREFSREEIEQKKREQIDYMESKGFKIIPSLHQVCLQDISEIHISGKLLVEIDQEKIPSVIFDISSELEQFVVMSQKEKILWIKSIIQVEIFKQFERRNIKVCLPNLDKISASGGVHLSLYVCTSSLEINANGGSRVEVKGNGKEVFLDVGGGSQVNLLQFPINNLKGNIGTSVVEVCVKDQIDLSRNRGKLRYKGAPIIVCHNNSGIISSLNDEI